MPRPSRFAGLPLLLCFGLLLWTRPVAAEDAPEFPAHAKVLEGFTKVVTVADETPLWTVWKRAKDGQLLAELPRTFDTQKYFIALTLASGDKFAGLQGNDLYVYWRRYDKRLVLIQPNVEIRSTGDDGSKASIKRLFTDTVLLDLPIVTIGPGGGPVIDLDELCVANATKFFGPGVQNREIRGLFSVEKVKAFKENLELAFEMPNSQGKLQTLHYSISVIPENPHYKSRVADERVGYFTTSYADYGRYTDEDVRTRYINRWHLEKADSTLRLSPPKKPIVFYIEHTTPIRYRRWVREGILDWNQAFEKVGIVNAIEVVQQDATKGSERHMDKDPEDVRYNFVRWLNNDVGTAIGPSRVNPLTGEILDADIILTDGWIRHFKGQFEKLLPAVAMEGFSAETLAWLAQNPSYDPRVRLARPSDRAAVAATTAREAARPLAGHPAGAERGLLMGDNEFDGLIGRTSQMNGLCLAAQGQAFNVALMRMHFDLLLADVTAEPPVEAGKPVKKEKKLDEGLLDGMPESFIGPLLAHLVAHEVGHTIGLRHNFKASSVFGIGEMNEAEFKGRPLAASVMDYTPINMMPSGQRQGEFAMTGIGPYDEWAIEYGYTASADLKPVLARVAEPELAYATDEDATGPDPFARRYDLGKDPLTYAANQAALIEYHRGRLLQHFVKDGDSWAKARQGYELTLGLQFRAVGMMANWVGGTFVNRDHKGDPNGRPPLVPVPAADQRAALDFVIAHSFTDDAYGLTPDLMRHLTSNKWLDGEDWQGAFQDATWPIHDRIMGLQASALTMVMNPTTLRRVYDNEFVVATDVDALTLAEVMAKLKDSIWTELSARPAEPVSPRAPMISSTRRNLQKEHLGRLVDLAMPGAGSGAAFKPVGALAGLQLRDLKAEIDACLAETDGKVDPYTKAHLVETREMIAKALDSEFIYNAKSIGGGGGTMILRIGEEGQGR